MSDDVSKSKSKVPSEDYKKTVARAKSKAKLLDRDTDIINRVITLENRREHPPSILDLLCAGFTIGEIHSVSDELDWLYGLNWAYRTVSDINMEVVAA